jgi:hypothetical protein
MIDRLRQAVHLMETCAGAGLPAGFGRAEKVTDAPEAQTCVDVACAIADVHRSGQVEIVLRRRLMIEPGGRFAAVAGRLTVGRVRTVITLEQAGPLGRQQLVETGRPISFSRAMARAAPGKSRICPGSPRKSRSSMIVPSRSRNAAGRRSAAMTLSRGDVEASVYVDGFSGHTGPEVRGEEYRSLGYFLHFDSPAQRGALDGYAE